MFPWIPINHHSSACAKNMAVLRPKTPESQAQMAPFPLLRRPRPPPTVPQSPQSLHIRKNRSLKKTSDLDKEDTKLSGAVAFGLKEDFGAISTPVHPLPRHHPTPTSPLRSVTRRQNLPSSPIHEDKHGEGAGTALQILQHSVVNDINITRGPPPFPTRKYKSKKLRKRKTVSPNKQLEEEEADDNEVFEFLESASMEQEEDYYEFLPMFIDLTILEETALYEPPRTKLRERVISRQNYLKLTGWFATHVPQQDTLNTTVLEVDHSAPEGRKPHHQVLLELQSMVDNTLMDASSSDKEEENTVKCQRWPTPTPRDVVFRSSTSRYFLGEGRSNSPFDSGGQPLISPSEVAILESMMEGGHRLSLKAHFLDSLPSLAPFSLTLTSFNISFNTLCEFPIEILELRQLRNLRMRNNPIETLPNGIKKLVKLEDFCISFNCLTSLPSGLFELPLLQRLDVSHNYLQVLSRDIAKLMTLRRLNLESNELIGLPSSLLSLPLTHLHIHGNYLHPILWKENCKSPPMSLVDTCCTVLSAIAKEDKFPLSVKEILDWRISEDKCDICGRGIFGSGLRVVRLVARPEDNPLFPLKTLPVLFQVCSQKCKHDTRL